jgi:tight adherence protein C
MLVQAMTANSNIIVAFMAALSVFLATLACFWSVLVPSAIGVRMRRMAGEHEAGRVRARMKLNIGKETSLKTEPKKIFKQIFDRLYLAREAGDSVMVQNLRMAGYRGHGPIVTFLAMRLIMPFVLCAVAAFYIFIVLDPPYSVFAKLSAVVAVTLAGYYAPAIYVKNRITKRKKSIRRAWPDALDLLLICVESGMGLESAFRKISEEMGSQSSELAEELSLTTAELSYLADRRMAYENLGTRTGLDDVKGVVTCLVQAEKFGTPVGPSLRAFAKEYRYLRMSEAERKAMSLPPKLTVPMILFFLPVQFAIIIAPGAIQMFHME